MNSNKTVIAVIPAKHAFRSNGVEYEHNEPIKLTLRSNFIAMFGNIAYIIVVDGTKTAPTLESISLDVLKDSIIIDAKDKYDLLMVFNDGKRHECKFPLVGTSLSVAGELILESGTFSAWRVSETCLDLEPIFSATTFSYGISAFASHPAEFRIKQALMGEIGRIRIQNGATMTNENGLHYLEDNTTFILTDIFPNCVFKDEFIVFGNNTSIMQAAVKNPLLMAHGTFIVYHASDEMRISPIKVSAISFFEAVSEYELIIENPYRVMELRNNKFSREVTRNSKNTYRYNEAIATEAMSALESARNMFRQEEQHALAEIEKARLLEIEAHQKEENAVHLKSENESLKRRLEHLEKCLEDAKGTAQKWESTCKRERKVYTDEAMKQVEAKLNVLDVEKE